MVTQFNEADGNSWTNLVQEVLRQLTHLSEADGDQHVTQPSAGGIVTPDSP